jgi:hypothetical protein
VSRARDALLVGTVALLLAGALFEPTRTPDGERFARQAAELRAGLGFNWAGAPTSAHPPGYPAFLALLPTLDDAGRARVNVLLWVGACVLLHALLRPVGVRAARWGALALAANPWAARQVSYPMSEPLALLLALALALSAHRLVGVPGPARPAWMAALCGLAAAALALTAPGVLVVAGGVVAVVGWTVRSRRAALVPLLAGVALPMLPWQLHCLRATGHVEWLVVGRAGNFTAGRGLWARTWLVRESELAHVWHPERLADAPARAFRDEAERASLAALAGSGDAAALDGALRDAARARLASDPSLPWRFTLARVATLWLDMPALGHVQPSWVLRLSPSTWRADVSAVGTRRALLRLAKAGACTAAQAVYAAYALAVLGLAWRARRPLALAIVAGTCVYTLVSAASALGEARRNLPFVALLLALPALARRAPNQGPDPAAAGDVR